MHVDRLTERLTRLQLDALEECLPPQDRAPRATALREVLSVSAAQLMADLRAFSERDPASRGKASVVLEGYSAFAAVLHYRLAHAVWRAAAIPAEARMILAHRLSGRGKRISGADIHPAAQIGARFILDHGYGTVIGESCRIGEDCYILNNVTLGACGIADNPDGLRHPRIGNNVEIGSHARILGPITIGDDVFVSAHCLIRTDVPAGTRVRLVSQIQLEKADAAPRRALVSAFVSGRCLHLIGPDADSFSVSVVDDAFAVLGGLHLRSARFSPNHAQYLLEGEVQRTRQGAGQGAGRLHLRLARGAEVVHLLDPPGLCDLALPASGPGWRP